MNALTPELLLVKTAILEEVKQWLQEQNKQNTLQSPLLKSAQVKQILNVSRNTLCMLRKKGILSSTKIGGSYRYYAGKRHWHQKYLLQMFE